MWASGDFAVIGTTLQIVGETLCEAVDLRAGERVLDVAAGNGNATLAAARRFAEVTSTDYVPALLEGGRRRAEAAGPRRARSRRPTPRRCRTSDGELRRRALDVRRDVRARSSALGQRNCCACAVPAAASGWRTGRPTGFIGELFRAVAPARAAACRACSRRCSGARDRAPARRSSAACEDRAHAARSSTSATSRPSTSWTCSARSTVRCTRRLRRSTMPARPRSRRTCWRCCASRIAAGGGLVVPAEYLEIVITR